jgi:hypothetical protein
MLLLAVDASDDAEDFDPYSSDLSRLFAKEAATRRRRSSATLASKIKFDDLCKHFAQVDRTVLQSIFDMCDGDTRRTVETLRAAGMSSPAFPPPPAPKAAPKLTPGPTWRGSPCGTKHIKPATPAAVEPAFRKVPSKASRSAKEGGAAAQACVARRRAAVAARRAGADACAVRGADQVSSRRGGAAQRRQVCRGVGADAAGARVSAASSTVCASLLCVAVCAAVKARRRSICTVRLSPRRFNWCKRPSISVVSSANNRSNRTICQ